MTITTIELIRQAMSAIEEANIAGESPAPLVLETPSSAWPGHGGPVEWHPLIALAAAGHIVQHWTAAGFAHKGPFEIESGSHVGHAATLCRPGDNRRTSLRMAAGGFPDDPAVGIWVRELCGHPGCPDEAPAGPGTRCYDHLGDPVPAGQPAAYWAQLAADAWSAQHPTAGEAAVLLTNRRNALIAGALAADMGPMELQRRTGIARTTISRIVTPPQPPTYDEDDDNAPA